MKHVIWTNEIDTSDEAMEDYRNFLATSDPDCPSDVFTDEDVMRFMAEDNDRNLEDERANVGHVEMRHSSTILCTGTLGLWHGTVMGYKLLEDATLDKIFDVAVGDYVEFYEEDDDVRCTDTHHDGTNHYVFRELKTDDMDNPDIEEMLDVIADAGKDADRQAKAWELIGKHTYSLSPYWQEVYGWTD